MDHAGTSGTPAGYRAALAGLILFLTLTLLALLDIRRGFLLDDYPVRSLFYVFAPSHAILLLVGVAGMLACRRRLRELEALLSDRSRLVKVLTFVILALLVIDLFTYRIVPATRSVASGRISLDWVSAFGATGWWRPLAQATSYLFTVWHATMLGVLISGLALTMLPAYSRTYFTRGGLAGSLFGALFALPQPFCSCCSSVMAPSLVRRGASTAFLLSFVVGAPMLNITTSSLALVLLPLPFAITRILAGILITVLATYLVVHIAERWDRPTAAAVEAPGSPGWWRRVAGLYRPLVDLDVLARPGSVSTPAQLFDVWLRASGRLALVLVPMLWLWSAIASAAFQALPPAFGNNLSSVVLAAVGGTFFMISTWSEIPMALELIEAGFSGPAAALLVVLPAISLPCMMLLAGALQRFRIVALLSATVMVVGIAAGAMFL